MRKNTSTCRSHNYHSGFTLVELLIGLALGLMVLYAAVAGFRSAALSTATANRLSLENTLMREGLHRARDELDFWTAYDDPTDPALQLLRPVVKDQPDWEGSVWRGQSFTPLRDLAAQGVFAQSGLPGDESERGWNPSSTTWQVNDPRTWYRGNMAELVTPPETNKNGTIIMPEGDLRFGRYALISSVSATLGPDNLAHDGIARFDKGPFLDERSTAPYPGSAPIADYCSAGPIPVPHTWYPNQVEGLVDSLGFYAAIDYLPCNVIWGYYQPYRRPYTGGSSLPNHGNRFQSTNLGGYPIWMMRSYGGYYTHPGYQYGDSHFLDRSDLHGDTKGSSANYPRSAYDASYGGSYIVPNPMVSVPANLTISLPLYRYRTSRYEFAVNTLNTGADSADAVNNALGATAHFEPLLDVKPAKWPDVEVSVSRFYTFGRQANICRIQRLSPVTGEIVELSFTGIGSTLRGARNQRDPNGGWAVWDNATSFNPALHPTLDSY
jgi:prepilin-type N-terminal cleavage/methylation domain-containing protein